MAQLVTGRRSLPEGRLEEEREEQVILHDLVDALLFEDLLGARSRGVVVGGTPPGVSSDWVLEADERWFMVPLADASSLVFRVRPSPVLQPWRLSRPPVLLVPGAPAPEHREGTALAPVDVLGALARGMGGQEEVWPNLPNVLHDLRLSVAQGARSRTAAPRLLADLAGGTPGFLAWERWATLRDRPFHPTARAKHGWSVEEYERYAAEFGRPFALDWVAVRRDHVTFSGDPAGPVAALLDEAQQEGLRSTMERDGVDPAGHVAIPVHPWQAQRVLPALFRDELEARVVRLVPFSSPGYVATSSVRSVAPAGGGGVHLKLPLGVESLGALRVLPPRYQHNGSCGQVLLEELRSRVPQLAGMLAVCDERLWWSFLPPGEDGMAEKCGHLGCMLRRYPDAGLGVALLPMGALAVVGPDGSLPAARCFAVDLADRPVELLGRIAELLTEVCLLCFAHGAMPEVHGQNVVLMVRGGVPHGLLLRDLDTVRIHPAWLERSGLRPPAYRVKPGTPNTLVLADPESLLAWFQSLAIEVNLAAVADAFSRSYGIALVDLWGEIGVSVRRALDRVELPAHAAGLVRSVLLEREQWPSKLFLGPLLERSGREASMPSALGRITNPLRLAAVAGGAMA